MFAARRAEFRSRMRNGIAILPSTPVFLRNGDVEHEYRPASDVYYLTGFDEPEAVVVLSADSGRPAFTLFCRTRNPEREIWDGPRAGIEGARSEFGAEQSYPIASFFEELPKLLENTDRLYYRLGVDPAFDAKVVAAIREVRGRARTGVRAPSEIVDPAGLLHEMRLLKSADEVALMQKAADITAAGHRRAMEVARPKMYEYELEAELSAAFRTGGAERHAYSPIVGSGPNATILHHRKNDRCIEAGDLVLIDAGAEYRCYAADVTRTFPISGRFTPEQRAIYDIVLEAQVAAIEAVRPGRTVDEIHDVAVRRLTQGLVDLKLLDGPVDAAIEAGAFRAFYMHRTSHWLGMDVHDVGSYFESGKPRPLVAGMVLTIEPGIYIGVSAEKAEPRWRGIGVRIEDDLLVTESGSKNLTAAIPKAPSDLER